MKQTELTKALNVILSDMHVMIAKLHNYHWNVYGIQFYTIHEITEGYYDYFFGLFDDVAERILQLEAKPVATVSGYLELATLVDESGDHFKPGFVMESLIKDFQHFIEAAKKADGLAEGDIPTQDMLSGLIIKLEKEIWLIKSTLGK